MRPLRRLTHEAVRRVNGGGGGEHATGPSGPATADSGTDSGRARPAPQATYRAALGQNTRGATPHKCSRQQAARRPGARELHVAPLGDSIGEDGGAHSRRVAPERDRDALRRLRLQSGGAPERGQSGRNAAQAGRVTDEGRQEGLRTRGRQDGAASDDPFREYLEHGKLGPGGARKPDRLDPKAAASQSAPSHGGAAQPRWTASQPRPNPTSMANGGRPGPCGAIGAWPGGACFAIAQSGPIHARARAARARARTR